MFKDGRDEVSGEGGFLAGPREDLVRKSVVREDSSSSEEVSTGTNE